MKTLIVATGNSHKAREIAALTGGLFEPRTLKDVGFPGEIDEHGATFEENARIKLAALMDFCRQLPPGKIPLDSLFLADDSGLEVDVLKGEPGVRSARYAGEPCNDEANNQKLLKALDGIEGFRRIARFRCVLAASHLEGGPVQIFHGACEGKVGFSPKGSHGFGYDPIFFPEGFCRTYAELTAGEKNDISHRAQALEKFKAWVMKNELHG